MTPTQKLPQKLKVPGLSSLLVARSKRGHIYLTLFPTVEMLTFPVFKQNGTPF